MKQNLTNAVHLISAIFVRVCQFCSTLSMCYFNSSWDHDHNNIFVADMHKSQISLPESLTWWPKYLFFFFFTEWSRFKYGKRFHPRPRDKRKKLEADSTMTHKSCNLKYIQILQTKDKRQKGKNDTKIDELWGSNHTSEISDNKYLNVTNY